MDKILSVWVHRDDTAVLAGRLLCADNKYTFVYAEHYRQNKTSIPLDPIHLPLNQKEFVSTDLFGALRDASPDSWGRLLIAKRINASINTLSDMDCILQSSNDRVGCLEFTLFTGNDDISPKPCLPLTLDMIADGIRNLAEGKDISDDILDVLKYGSSMGGARPKASVIHDGIHYLAKFNRNNDPVNMCRCEHATMRLAATLGVHVAQTHIQQVAGIDVLMVKRFDRLHGIKLPFISALTASEYNEMDFMHSSYIELSDLTHQISSSNHGQEWFRRMIFNILCNNDDDHLRNHGFLFQNGTWSLTPAYDIMPHAIHGETYRLAIGLTHGNRDASIANAMQASQAMGIEIECAQSIANSMMEGFKQWQQHFLDEGVCQKDIQFFARTFDRHYTD